MGDDRTLIEKLRAMAADTSSPQEAEIARAKLETMGASPPPPTPPAPPVAPGPEPERDSWVIFTTTGSSSTTSSGSFNVRWEFRGTPDFYDRWANKPKE